MVTTPDRESSIMKVVMVINNMRADSGVCSAVASVANQLHESGIEVYIATLNGIGPMKKRLRFDANFIIDLSRAKTRFSKGLVLRKFVKKNKVDIIHGNMHNPVVVSYIAQLGTEAKLAITEHSTLMPAENWIKGFMENSSDGFFFRRASVRVAVSRSVACTWAARTYSLPTNISVVPNSSDHEYLGVNTRKRKLGKTAKILFMGRFALEKNAMLLLEITHKLKKRGLAVQLSIIGSGQLEKEIYDEISRLDLAGNVKVMKPDTRVGSLIRKHDVLALVSHWEGCPMTILESYSTGTPVIGTRVPGIMDIVDHMRSGVLIGTEPTEQDIESIYTLLTNQKTYAKLSEGALMKSKSFQSGNVAKEYTKLYQSTVGK